MAPPIKQTDQLLHRLIGQPALASGPGRVMPWGGGNVKCRFWGIFGALTAGLRISG